MKSKNLKPQKESMGYKKTALETDLSLAYSHCVIMTQI